jgi:hypothetical protein
MKIAGHSQRPQSSNAAMATPPAGHTILPTAAWPQGGLSDTTPNTV